MKYAVAIYDPNARSSAAIGRQPRLDVYIEDAPTARMALRQVMFDADFFEQLSEYEADEASESIKTLKELAKDNDCIVEVVRADGVEE